MSTQANSRPGNLSILIVDDEQVSVNNLSYALKKSGYHITTRTSGPDGINALENHHFDIVITDLKMEHADGMSILEKSKAINSDIAVIMITGHASLDTAIQAMKAGAFHYIEKPFRLDEVREIIKNAADLVTTKRENKQLQLLVQQNSQKTRIITQDAGMRRLLDNAYQIATTDSTVLITGESGTGKELIARTIHENSQRNHKPFIAVNCGAFQEDLLANELFGHEKGAFTGANESRGGLIEAADGGTLFLDEIAEMSLPMQVKLLRVIQEQEVQRLGSTSTSSVNIRYLAATNRELLKEIAAGRFRNDLYYRLNVVSLHLPPLLERRDDIPLLAYYFLKKHALQMGRDITDISAEAMATLVSYDYPGNIRELENLIERGIALATQGELTTEQLPKALNDQSIQLIRGNNNKLPTLEQREEEYIRWVLKETGGNKTQAANILGIARPSLWRKLKKYMISD